MGIVRTEGVVLRTYPFSETSKIIHAFTLEYGPQSLMARGARRPKSKFGGLLETFTRLELIYYQKRTGSIHTLSEGSLIEYFSGLSEDLARFYAGSVCLEMIKRYVMPDEVSKPLYNELVNTLGMIDVARPDECQYVLLGFLWRFITLQGFKPDLNNCSMCGRVLSGPARLVINEVAVGTCCERCADSHRGMGMYDKEIGKLIGLMTSGQEVGPSSAGENIFQGIWAFTSNYIKYHLHQERLVISLRTFLAYIESTRGREE
jgi:DNA repair protein RecO (recombination protein O)